MALCPRGQGARTAAGGPCSSALLQTAGGRTGRQGGSSAHTMTGCTEGPGHQCPRSRSERVNDAQRPSQQVFTETNLHWGLDADSQLTNTLLKMYLKIDAFPRTVKAIKMQKTSLGKIEPKSQLMFKIARHLVSVCAPRTHWQPRPLPRTPPAQRVSCSRSAPGPARRGPEGRWSPPQRCPSHWGPHRSRPRRPRAPERPMS